MEVLWDTQYKTVTHMDTRTFR